MRLLPALLFLLLTTSASAHDWYPAHCCSDRDCTSVECDTLSDGPNGSVNYTPRDKTFDRKKVYPSQDSKCHICLHGDSPLCVFVQQGS
jgi:hypothetical protein